MAARKPDASAGIASMASSAWLRKYALKAVSCAMPTGTTRVSGNSTRTVAPRASPPLPATSPGWPARKSG